MFWRHLLGLRARNDDRRREHQRRDLAAGAACASVRLMLRARPLLTAVCGHPSLARLSPPLSPITEEDPQEIDFGEHGEHYKHC